ncbi:MAG: type I methionyl aminopeptidase [Gammaproteobacteria bacterium]|nr:type I methionyl aminopeptidase [Gammaproteobacteria bacterium]
METVHCISSAGFIPYAAIYNNQKHRFWRKTGLIWRKTALWEVLASSNKNGSNNQTRQESLPRMSIIIKTAEDIEKMRVAGHLAAEQLTMIAPHIKPGVTTDELNDICHDFTVNVQNAIPAPLNYHGFPKSICTSVNHQVCHGIPSDKKLKKGDIVNIDVTVIKDGYHGDTSKMFFVGEPSVLARRVCDISHECMKIGIELVKPGIHLGDIGHAIQKYAEAKNCSVVREYCGHGIGTTFHEEPQVLHYGDAGTGIILEPGMIFTIEPMINAGKRQVKLLKDKWTVVTKDRSLSAQWEHTILVTNDGHEVLTKLPDDEL